MSELPHWKETIIGERDAMVAAMAKEGLSASQIARRFRGVSKNAVINLCARRGYKLHGRPPKPPKAVAAINRPRLPPPDATNFPPLRAPLPGPAPVGITEVTGCRWPVEGGFCNHKRHVKSYCATHHALAYKEITPGF